MLNVIMKWTYSASKRPSASFASEWIDGEAALKITEDLEKAGRLKEVEFEDEMGTAWTKKELKKLLSEVEEEPQNVTVYFDGGFRKEDQMSGIGVAIYFQQGKKQWRIRKNELLEQLESNNEAEYAALYEAVKQLDELEIHHQSCVFKGDSLVVLNQLSGEWPCYEEELNKWLDRIEEVLKKRSIRAVCQPVSRKENREADQLASQALNGENIYSKLEVTDQEKKESL